MYKDKKIFILGMARSGYEVAKLLAPDNKILITDVKPQDNDKVKELEGIGVEFILSDKPDDFSYTVKDHVDYLYGFVHELNLQSFIIFAHSLGGPIGIELAKRCGDQVTALVLSESNLDPSSVGSSSYDFGTCKEEDFVYQMFEEVVEKSTLKNSMWAATLSVCSPKAMHRISQSAVVGGNPSWRNLLYSLTCKRTFIFGAESLPDDDKIELERHEIQIEIVPSAGHSMAWENPKGLANAIKRSV